MKIPFPNTTLPHVPKWQIFDLISCVPGIFAHRNRMFARSRFCILAMPSANGSFDTSPSIFLFLPPDVYDPVKTLLYKPYMSNDGNLSFIKKSCLLRQIMLNSIE